MLTKVEISTDKGDLLVLPLEYTDNGYLVQNIDGLDPVKAVLSSSPFGNLDGEQFQSSRAEARNIVITLGLESGKAGTVRDLRNKLYALLMPKARVYLQFFSDDLPMVEIEGMVESCIAPLFTKEPLATISFLCYKPNFYDPNLITLVGSTVNDTSESLLTYEGSVNSGISLVLRPTRAVSRFTVYHRSSFDVLSTLEFNQPLSAGDVLNISTSPGAKMAYITRGGTQLPMLYAIPVTSNYIELTPGVNTIRVHAEGDPVPYEITYTNKIGGL